MQVALFDHKVVPTNPIGGSHRRLLQGLCGEHDFTVFAVEFDNPSPERIRSIKVPLPTRPFVIMFLAYHLLAPLFYVGFRLRHRSKFDLVQIVESNLIFGDVSYTHFCHRAFLRHHWAQIGARGLRGWLRWLDHRLHALLEPSIYRRVRHVVVPSHGLMRELEAEYPVTRGKVSLIPNPVDSNRMRQPSDFDSSQFRAQLGLEPDAVLFVFVALGQFERKGLPVLLEALQQLDDPHVRLLVVGGEPELVRKYRSRTERMGLARNVMFAGMQEDVRPYLWAADAFVFPSFYEVFPLVALEAAAASLPLIATRLYGVEEFLIDGENGLIVSPTAQDIALGVKRFLALSDAARRAMGERAAKSVQHFTVEDFLSAWRRLYENVG
ncbi:MAG: glycosyltransferase family 4 protein [Actinomycetota bacterium]|nr:glycosyltransferase family 4 protein [Actinomycetota bacterium]